MIKTLLSILFIGISLNAHALDFSKQIAHVTFNDNAANKTLDDSSVTNNDGTYSSNSSTTYVEGKIGGAHNDYFANLPFHEAYTFTNISAAIWVKPAALTVGNAFMAQWNYSNNYRSWYMLQDTTTKEKFTVRLSPTGTNTGATYTTSNDNIFSVDTWTHIAFTYSTTGPTIKLYVNGALINSTGAPPASLYHAHQPLAFYNIEAGYGAGDYNGLLDDARVFNYVISENDIKILYNAGHGTEYDFNPQVILTD